MSDNQMERLMKARRRGKPSYKQTPMGVFVLVMTMVILGVFYFHQRNFFYYGFMGVFIGYILRRGKFCFVAGMRDPYLIGTTALLRGIIISIMISTLGYGLWECLRQGQAALLEVPMYIDGVSYFTAIGGLLFGIGMVIAGGCATGTVIRIGEGYRLQILVLIGFIIGATGIGAVDGIWEAVGKVEKIVYFPSMISLPMAIGLQEFVLLCLYFMARKYEKKRFSMEQSKVFL